MPTSRSGRPKKRVAEQLRAELSWAQASIADVVACYRLLLGREPDVEGFSHYRSRIDEGLAVADLVGEFTGSVEFIRAHGGQARANGAVTETIQVDEGFVMCVDPTDFAVGHTIARTARYEPEVSSVVREILEPGQTFVDAGANIGWFSLLAAAVVGPDGRVVAVEPNPANVMLLRNSARQNGFGNIEATEAALGAAPGVAALETDGSNGRVILLDGTISAPLSASFVVPVRPLDEILASYGIPHVDAMKLDVEGAEPLILSGALETIHRDHPVIVTEFYPLALDCAPWGSAQGYLDELRRLGYRLSVIGEATAPDALYGHDDGTIFSLAGPQGQVNLLATHAG